MRITAFRAWVHTAIQQGVGAARRAGMAISRRIRPSGNQVDAGVGVGDDESKFGGGRGSRAWLTELLEDVARRIRALFENSRFERRFVRVEAFLRKLLGLPPVEKIAPRLPPPRKPGAGRSSAPPPVSAEQAARFRQQIQMGRVQANTARQAGLREIKRASGDRKKPGDEKASNEGEDPDQT